MAKKLLAGLKRLVTGKRVAQKAAVKRTQKASSKKVVKKSKNVCEFC